MKRGMMYEYPTYTPNFGLPTKLMGTNCYMKHAKTSIHVHNQLSNICRTETSVQYAGTVCISGVGTKLLKLGQAST